MVKQVPARLLPVDAGGVKVEKGNYVNSGHWRLSVFERFSPSWPYHLEEPLVRFCYNNCHSLFRLSPPQMKNEHGSSLCNVLLIVLNTLQPLTILHDPTAVFNEEYTQLLHSNVHTSHPRLIAGHDYHA